MSLLIVVPYRDREEHLSKFVPFIFNKLQEQSIESNICVVEQDEGKLFNRGILCNIGFDLFKDDFTHFCFHDVDMICEKIIYKETKSPYCLIEKRTKNKIYASYFGGIVLFPKNDFLTVNGFSNKYWGWGCEDNDLFKRCSINNIKAYRGTGECFDLENISNHENIIKNNNYKSNLSYFQNINKEIIQNDGLNDLNDLYDILEIKKYHQYIKIKVSV